MALVISLVGLDSIAPRKPQPEFSCARRLLPFGLRRQPIPIDRQILIDREIGFAIGEHLRKNRIRIIHRRQSRLLRPGIAPFNAIKPVDLPHRKIRNRTHILAPHRIRDRAPIIARSRSHPKTRFPTRAGKTRIGKTIAMVGGEGIHICPQTIVDQIHVHDKRRYINFSRISVCDVLIANDVTHRERPRRNESHACGWIKSNNLVGVDAIGDWKLDVVHPTAQKRRGALDGVVCTRLRIGPDQRAIRLKSNDGGRRRPGNPEKLRLLGGGLMSAEQQGQAHNTKMRFCSHKMLARPFFGWQAPPELPPCAAAATREFSRL